jgi:hypothetical protein
MKESRLGSGTEAKDGDAALHKDRFAVSGLAATLRAADPGTRVKLTLDDGREVGGSLRGVNGETVDLDEARVELRRVRRLCLEFGSATRNGRRKSGLNKVA